MTPEQIAADVSARYGIPVSPDAVKIIPQGQMADAPRYVWTGHKLEAIEPQENPIRRVMNAQYNARKKAAALAKADKPKKPNAMKVYSEKRQAEARAMAAAGATYDQIAERWGVTQPFVRKFCNKHGIKVKIRTSGRRASAPDRLARVTEFAGDGNRYLGELAEFMGVSKKAASDYLRRRGIPYRTMMKAA
jgi:predicted transcriptional regulator